MLHTDPKKRRAKVKVLESLLQKADIICLQETHGDLASLTHFFGGRWAGWSWRHSPGVTRGEGGCSIGVCSASFSPLCGITYQEIVKGRVLTAEFPTLRITNIHRHGLTPAQNLATCKMLKEDALRARMSESPRSSIACGDWNFNLSGAPSLHLSEPRIVDLAPPGAPACGAPHLWVDALKDLTCVITAEPTHYCAESRKMSHLDGWYLSLPPWALAHLPLRGETLTTADELSSKNTSDHCPIVLTISSRERLPRGSATISATTFRGKAGERFQEIHNKLTSDCDLSSHNSTSRWSLHKKIIRKAAIAARDFASDLSPLSPAVRRSRLAAIARAYSYQDSKLAYKMQEVCDEARRHLLVQRGKVELILKNRFNMDFEHTMQEVIHENSCNDSHPDTARVTDKSKNARSQRARTAASWSPFGKRVLLAGVLLPATTANPTGILLRDPTLQNNALIAHWSKVFCDVPHFPEEKAKNISDKFGIDLKGIDLVLPSSECIQKFLRRAKNSAPGPDGLPYAAWLACGDSGASTLHGILLDVCDGRIPATSFNDTNIVFLPKSDVCCPGGLIAAPGATRPLGLKNTDNKAIAATLASALASAISATASPVQQGFVRGRRFTDNIIEVDWAARRALEIPQNGPWGSSPWLSALLALFDVRAAFPSVSQKWLKHTIQNSGLPIGLQKALLCMYESVSTMTFGAGVWNHQFYTKSGVLQGCPLSGVLFVMILDAFLRMMKIELDIHGGSVRACADDVAAVVHSGPGLVAIHAIFQLAKEIANLGLNTDKGKIIPLGAKNIEEATQNFKKWCIVNIPDFAATPVARVGKYLGVLVGPGSGRASWKGVITKVASRAKSIGLARPPIGNAMNLYNSRVVPVVGYVAQFLDPPSDLMRREQTGIHHCLGLATNAAAWKDLHAFSNVTKLNLRSAPITAVAALWRAAVSWSGCWAPLLASKHSSDHGMLYHLTDPLGWSKEFDCAPSALLLKCISDGLPAHDLSRLRLDKSSLLSLWAPAIRAAHATIPWHSIKPEDLQKTIYKHLRNTLNPPDPRNTILKRISGAFARFRIPPRAIDWTAVFLETQKLPLPTASAWMKTICNSWPTSSRMHEANAPRCLFLCGNEDCLAHYLACPILLQILEEARGIPPPTPGELLGVIAPCRVNFEATHAAYRLYCVLKFEKTAFSYEDLVKYTRCVLGIPPPPPLPPVILSPHSKGTVRPSCSCTSTSTYPTVHQQYRALHPPSGTLLGLPTSRSAPRRGVVLIGSRLGPPWLPSLPRTYLPGTPFPQPLFEELVDPLETYTSNYIPSGPRVTLPVANTPRYACPAARRHGHQRPRRRDQRRPDHNSSLLRSSSSRHIHRTRRSKAQRGPAWTTLLASTRSLSRTPRHSRGAPRPPPPRRHAPAPHPRVATQARRGRGRRRRAHRSPRVQRIRGPREGHGRSQLADVRRLYVSVRDRIEHPLLCGQELCVRPLHGLRRRGGCRSATRSNCRRREFLYSPRKMGPPPPRRRTRPRRHRVRHTRGPAPQPRAPPLPGTRAKHVIGPQTLHTPPPPGTFRHRLAKKPGTTIPQQNTTAPRTPGGSQVNGHSRRWPRTSRPASAHRRPGCGVAVASTRTHRRHGEPYCNRSHQGPSHRHPASQRAQTPPRRDHTPGSAHFRPTQRPKSFQASSEPLLRQILLQQLLTCAPPAPTASAPIRRPRQNRSSFPSTYLPRHLLEGRFRGGLIEQRTRVQRRNPGVSGRRRKRLSQALSPAALAALPHAPSGPAASRDWRLLHRWPARRRRLRLPPSTPPLPAPSPRLVMRGNLLRHEEARRPCIVRQFEKSWFHPARLPSLSTRLPESSPLPGPSCSRSRAPFSLSSGLLLPTHAARYTPPHYSRALCCPEEQAPSDPPKTPTHATSARSLLAVDNPPPSSDGVVVGNLLLQPSQSIAKNKTPTTDSSDEPSRLHDSSTPTCDTPGSEPRPGFPHFAFIPTLPLHTLPCSTRPSLARLPSLCLPTHSNLSWHIDGPARSRALQTLALSTLPFHTRPSLARFPSLCLPTHSNLPKRLNGTPPRPLRPLARV